MSAAAAHYVGRVLRLRPGERLLAIDPLHGLEAEAVLLQVGRGARLEAEGLRPGRHRGLSGMHLVQCLGKGDKLERVLRDAVALGITRLHVVVSERSVARPASQSQGKRVRWADIAVEVARQCGRADIPALDGPMSFEQACELESGVDVVLQPGAPPLLAVVTERLLGPEAPIDERHPLRLWIGPEGGFAMPELERLRERGALQASLGALVLRTETAATAALAVVAAALHARS